VNTIQRVDERVAMLTSGIPSDGRALLKHAAREAALFSRKFGVAASASQLADMLGEKMHESSLNVDARPLAATVVIAGVGLKDDSPIELFSVDVGGEVQRQSVCAVGAGAEDTLERVCTDMGKLLDHATCEECAQRLREVLGEAAGDHVHVEVAMLYTESAACARWEHLPL
jgi:20S proteasome alpha/beta subunit